jgi:thiamine pyrophosphate-dependent acetolactate synthase large subunit-like protein
LPAARRALAVDLDLTGVGEPIVVLAGGGVVRGGAVPALRELAAVGHLGVLNTWTAKGVFEWTSPHHLGTAGLQARDFELAGLSDAALVVACGVDPAEAPRYRWALTEVVEVTPGELAQVGARWVRPPAAAIARPPLYTELAEVLAPHYAGDVPGSPAAAVLQAKADLPPGGLLAVDPGPAGLWVARTFPTEEVGSVAVPAVGDEGFAAGAALAATFDGRPAIAVTTEPAGPQTRDIVEAARALGVEIDLREWGPSIGVDFSHTRALEEVAGPVVAWT